MRDRRLVPTFEHWAAISTHYRRPRATSRTPGCSRWLRKLGLFSRWVAVMADGALLRKAAGHLYARKLAPALHTWKARAQSDDDPERMALGAKLWSKLAQRRGVAQWVRRARLRRSARGAPELAAQPERRDARVVVVLRVTREDEAPGGHGDDPLAARRARSRQAAVAPQRHLPSPRRVAGAAGGAAARLHLPPRVARLGGRLPGSSASAKAEKLVRLYIVGRGIGWAFQRWVPRFRAYAARKIAERFRPRGGQRYFLQLWQLNARQLKMVHAAIEHHRTQGRAGAWRTWVAAASEKRTDKLRRAARHLMHRSKAMALNKMKALFGEQSERKQKLRGALGKLKRSKKTAGWNTWSEMAKERREALQLMKRGVSYLRNRRLAGAFLRLRNNISNDGAMSRGLRHMLHRGLSRGWSAWCAHCVEARRKHESARRGLSHLVNRKLSAGWLTWRAAATQRREALQLMRKGLSFMVNRKRAVGFSWRSSFDAATRQASNADRRYNAKKKALRHLLHRGLSRGWVAWHARWQVLAAKRASARRGLSHLVNRKLSAGWNTWSEMAAERHELKRRMRKGLSMLVNRKLAIGFIRLQQKAPVDSLGRGVRHFMHRGLSRGWRAWHAQSQAMARKRASARRGLSHMVNRKLSAGWNTWSEITAVRRELMQRLRKGLSFMVNRQLAKDSFRCARRHPAHQPCVAVCCTLCTVACLVGGRRGTLSGRCSRRSVELRVAAWAT